MITENALVIYKSKPAIVKERADGKITILLQNNEQIKVRDKDIELIHQGPVKDFKQIDEKTNLVSISAIKEVWELLLDENPSLSLKELASFIYNDYTPATAYSAYLLLKDGLYFTGTISEITLHSKNEAEAEEAKRNEKLRETSGRSEFLELIKTILKKPSEKLFFSNDEQCKQYAHYMQDVEALAYGKSIKSRTLKDLKLSETPEDAHLLLLKTGFWTTKINPYPSRFCLSPNSAQTKITSIRPPASSDEERVDLRHLAAFAIDSPWSNDPDDAVSIEETIDGKTFLYVHVADPASSITFDSPAEKEARDRGVTLYLPEGAARMLAEEFLPLFALGLSENSPALTFKMTIDKEGNVIDTEIFPSIVKVRCISYEDVDKEINNSNPVSADTHTLHALYNLSQKIFKRRARQGAVNIDLPDVHINVKDGIVSVDPIITYKSDSLVKECMIAAGEGTGTWASSRGLALPYVSQEIELQEFSINSEYSEKNIAQTEFAQTGIAQMGFAQSFQLRRCMRPRILSTKPGFHQGLGIDIYTQVTSPLRRYTDLLAHMQIRAFLKGEKTLNADEVSSRIGVSEAGAIAAVQAERASNNHWLMVYLSDKKDSIWEAAAIENKGNRMLVIIPSLALETQVSLQKNVSPNETIKLMLKSVNIPQREAVFVQAF